MKIRVKSNVETSVDCHSISKLLYMCRMQRGQEATDCRAQARARFFWRARHGRAECKHDAGALLYRGCFFTRILRRPQKIILPARTSRRVGRSLQQYDGSSPRFCPVLA